MLNPNRKGSYKKMIPGLVGGHVLGMVVSLVVSSLLGRFENGYVTAVMYAVCLIFGLFFSYHEGWIAGGSDKVYINSKQINFTPWKGVKAGAWASIPNALVALLGFLSAVTPLGNVLALDTPVFQLIYRIWFWAFSCLYGLIDKAPVLHFLPIFAMPAACGVGYILGVKQFRLLDYIVYKKDNK